jgi:pimeloyl-ACP methyl ester carboxylesterase
VWQEEGAGEESIAGIIALDSDQLAAAFGVPAALAPDMAEHLDAAMGDAILRVYRSAVQPAMRDLGDQLAAADRRRALLIHATADPFVPPEMVFPVAERIGADILTLENLGHWWMFEDPAMAADGLVAFWDSAVSE